MTVQTTVLAVASSASGGSHSKWFFAVVGVFFVIVGGLNLAQPSLSWRMSRWQYKNKQALEPSNAALIATRVSGAIAVIIGIVLIVVGLSSL